MILTAILTKRISSLFQQRNHILSWNIHSSLKVDKSTTWRIGVKDILAQSYCWIQIIIMAESRKI